MYNSIITRIFTPVTAFIKIRRYFIMAKKEVKKVVLAQGSAAGPEGHCRHWQHLRRRIALCCRHPSGDAGGQPLRGSEGPALPKPPAGAGAGRCRMRELHQRLPRRRRQRGGLPEQLCRVRPGWQGLPGVRAFPGPDQGGGAKQRDLSALPAQTADKALGKRLRIGYFGYR